MTDYRFLNHYGCDIEIVTYPSGWALECQDCSEIIIDKVVWDMLNEQFRVGGLSYNSNTNRKGQKMSDTINRSQEVIENLTISQNGQNYAYAYAFGWAWATLSESERKRLLKFAQTKANEKRNN